MGVTPTEAIKTYQATLKGDDLANFLKLSEEQKAQKAIAIVETKEAAPTALGGLSNLDTKNASQKAPENVFESKVKTEDYWSVQKEKSNFKGVPYKVEEKAPEVKSETKETPIMLRPFERKPVEQAPVKEAPKTEPKTTQYPVQLGDSLEGVVKKSLLAQGIKNPDEKQLKEATEKFIADNGGVSKKGLIKENQNGVKFLSAGSTVKLDGDVDVTKNKSAKQVSHEWAKKYGHASGTTEHKDDAAVDKKVVVDKTKHKDGTHVDKAKDAVVEKPVDTKPVKGKNVTPTAEEIKGIKAENGGHFIKNTGTGRIMQVYSNADGRIVKSYDPKTKKIVQSDEYHSDKSSETLKYNEKGAVTLQKTTYADKSTETLYGRATISEGGKVISHGFGNRITTDVHGKSTYYKLTKDGPGATKWAEDKAPKFAAAPKAAEAPVVPKPAAVKGKIVTPTETEIKGLYKEKGGRFIKNIQTGNISQIFSIGDERTVVTYDKNKKSIQRDVYAADKSKRTSSSPDAKGFYTQLCETDSKGNKTYKVLKDGSWVNAAVPKVAADAAKAAAGIKKYIITPTIDEVKDITAEEGGHFIKNTKTGLISQIYTDPKSKVRAIKTYDKDKNVTQIDFYRGNYTETHLYDKDGKDKGSINHFKDKTSQFYNGNNGTSHYSTKSETFADGTKEYLTDPDANGEYHKKTTLKPDGTKTYSILKDGAWVLADIPKASPAAKVAAEAAVPVTPKPASTTPVSEAVDKTVDINVEKTKGENVTTKGDDGYFTKKYNDSKTGLPVVEKYDRYKRLSLKITHEKDKTVNNFYNGKGENTKREIYYTDGTRKIQENSDGLGHFAKVTIADATKSTVYTLFDRDQKPTRKTVIKDGVKESYKRDENGKWIEA